MGVGEGMAEGAVALVRHEDEEGYGEGEGHGYKGPADPDRVDFGDEFG